MTATALAGRMFRSVVKSADGSTDEGTYEQSGALLMLHTAVRRGYRVEATRQGGVVVTRDVRRANSPVPGTHTVTLTPASEAGKITDSMRRYLSLIDGMVRSPARLVDGRITFYVSAASTSATGRLLERGLVTVNGADVAVSLAARLAMLAQDHHTETREPRGYRFPSDLGREPGSGRMKDGRVLDRTSVASCSCRAWSYPAEDRDDARSRAHGHRREVTAAMLRALLNTT